MKSHVGGDCVSILMTTIDDSGTILGVVKKRSGLGRGGGTMQPCTPVEVVVNPPVQYYFRHMY